MIKHLQKKSIHIILVPSQRYQDSKHLLQNPKVPRSVMGFSNRAKTFTPLNKPAAQAAGADPSRSSFTNRLESPKIYYHSQFNDLKPHLQPLGRVGAVKIYSQTISDIIN